MTFRFCMALIISLFAVTVANAAEIKNDNARQEGNRMVVTYDLEGKEAEAQVSVSVKVGGTSYSADKLHLEGDFGKVRPGKGKRITWNVLQDFPRGLRDEAEVTVSAGGGQDDLVYIDPDTGLMWARDGNISGKKMTWKDAMSWAESLNYAGYSDWRLPIKEELVAFSKRGGRRSSEWFNANGFNNVQANYYWSGSTYAVNTNGAWVVSMGYGLVDGINKAYYYYVWPVRAGQ